MKPNLLPLLAATAACLFLLPAQGAPWTPFNRGAHVVGTQKDTTKVEKQADGIKVTWQAGTPSPIELLPDGSPARLDEPPEGPVELRAVFPAGTPVRQLHLRFRDASGETFQFSAVPAAGKPATAFVLDPAKASGIWGGDKNRGFDWPLRFHSVVLSLDKSGRAGEAVLQSVDCRLPPASLIAIECDTGDPLHLLPPGGGRPPKLVVRNAGDAPCDIAGTVEIGDAFGNTARHPLTGTVNGGGSLDFPLPGDFGRQGVWYIRARLNAGKSRRLVEREFSIARIVPAGPTRGFAPGFKLGVQAHPELYGTADQELMARAAALCGIKLVRLSSYWDSIQPTPDAWNIGYIDRITAPYEKWNLEVMLILGRTPQWAVAKDTVRPYPVKSRRLLRPEYDAFAAFSGRLAEHFRGRAAFFEVWNEPDIYFANFSVDEYLELLRRGYKAVKAAAPEIRVTTGGFAHIYEDRNQGPKHNIIRRCLNEGRQSHDVLAFHGHGSFEGYVNQLDYLFNLRAETPDPAPWLAGETAISDYRIGQLKQAETFFQKLIYSRARGAVGYIWYNLRNKVHSVPSEAGYGLLTKDLQPKAAYVVCNTLATWFCNSEYLRRIPTGPDFEFHLFRAPGGDLLLPYWSWGSAAADGRLLLLSGISGKLSRLDLFGNETPLAAAKGNLLLPPGNGVAFLRIQDGDGREPRIGELIRTEGTASIVPGGSGTAAFTLRNPAPDPLSIRLDFRMPPGLAGNPANCVLRLAPGEEKKIELGLKAAADFRSTSPLVCRTAVTGLPPEELKLPVYAARAVPVEGGNAGPLFTLDRQEQFYSFIPAAPDLDRLQWNGPEDLGAKIGLSAGKDFLRLRTTVADDRHVPVKQAADGWNGDSIQFALQLPGQLNFWEFCVIGRADGTTDLDITRIPNGGSASRAAKLIRAEVSRNEKKRETVYDVLIPFRAVGLVPGGGFQFNLIVNDNDGDCRKGFLRIAPGLGESKRPSGYPYLHLPRTE